jgi:hypothetical protein
VAKAAGIATGLAALMLLAMCQKSSTSVAGAANAGATPAAQADRSDGGRATVSAAHADCRVLPSPDAASVVRLTHAARLEVLERRGGWIKVSPTGEACWVAASQVDDSPAPDRAPAALYAPGVSDSTPITRRRSPRRSSGLYSAGSCACGSGNVCTGPRGGRYCITSGGNKRYGM